MAAWLYKHLFSKREEASYQKRLSEFVAEVETSFSLLFAEHSGTVHRDDGEVFRGAFDYVCLTLVFKEMRIQLIKGRGELNAHLAPTRQPEDWREFSFLQQIIAPDSALGPLFTHESLDQLAQQLRAGWNQLVDLLSEENWLSGLTVPEWRKFICLPSEEKLAILANRTPEQRKSNRYFSYS